MDSSFLEQLFVYWGWLLLRLPPSSYSYLTNQFLPCLILSIFFVLFLSVNSHFHSLQQIQFPPCHLLYPRFLPFPHTFCSPLSAISARPYLLVPKYSFPVLLTMPVLLGIMTACGDMLQFLPGMCCRGMAGMHGSHRLRRKCLSTTFSLQNVFFSPSPCEMLLVLFCLHRFHGSRFHPFMTFSSVAWTKSRTVIIKMEGSLQHFWRLGGITR